MTNISQRVLKPINEELSSIFNNLQINKVKDKKGRGGKIKYIEFTFDKQITSIRTKVMSNNNYTKTKQPKRLQNNGDKNEVYSFTDQTGKVRTITLPDEFNQNHPYNGWFALRL